MIKLKKIISEDKFTVKDLKKQVQLKAMGKKETSFAGWANKNLKDISATNGNKQKLLDMIDKAISNGKLDISDKYYNTVVGLIEKARKDSDRLYIVYNSMFKGKGLGLK